MCVVQQTSIESRTRSLTRLFLRENKIHFQLISLSYFYLCRIRIYLFFFFLSEKQKIWRIRWSFIWFSSFVIFVITFDNFVPTFRLQISNPLKRKKIIGFNLRVQSAKVQNLDVVHASPIPSSCTEKRQKGGRREQHQPSST